MQINSGGTAMAAIALTVGAILFGGAAGVLGQDGTNFFWDNTAKRLGIGNAAPTVALDVIGTGKFSTSVVTPLVQASAGLVVNANVGDINFQTAGTRRWNILNSTSALQPDQDNVWNFGAATARIASGFFGTGVETPRVVAGAGAPFQFGANGGSSWTVDATNIILEPVDDNIRKLGGPANRINTAFTPIIDSGTTGSLSLKTNNGTTQAEISHTGGTIVNWFQLTGNITTGAPQLRASGSDTDIDAIVSSKGAGSISLRTNNSAVVGLVVLHTASATSNATITGAAAAGTVGATIGVTGGRSLAITPAVVLASSLNFSTAAGKIIPGATSISLRNNADSADNLLVTDAGNVTLRGTLNGPAAMLSPITNSLGGNVALSNTGTFFDGPSVAQGTSGTWFVSGTVTLLDTVGAVYNLKLWDGTTVIASCVTSSDASLSVSASLSGFITSPAGNLRISVVDLSSVNGLIRSSQSGLGKDSTITAIRIA